MKIIYMGAFPPGYGGVTIKNKNLYDALSAKTNVLKVDLNKIKKRDIKETFKFITALLGRKNRFLIGVSGKQTRKKFTQLLYYVNRKAMNHSLIFLMGGTVADDIASDPEYLKYVSEYKMIYAETQSMVNILRSTGLKNVGLYPNGRFKPENKLPIKNCVGTLQCVFFSAVRHEKGVDIILDAAKSLPGISFAFYGPIEHEYQMAFMKKVNELPNVFYHGVFKGESENVYQELSKYDILLFPTMYKIEGVPGILVEGKIAGLAEVVSDNSYNSEIVKNHIEGIVLGQNDANNLVSALRQLENDREYLQSLKEKNALSAEKYYINNYIVDILDTISD